MRVSNVSIFLAKNVAGQVRSLCAQFRSIEQLEYVAISVVCVGQLWALAFTSLF